MFEWIKVGHLIAATVWFGGTIYVEALLANAKRTKDPQILGIVGLRVGKTNMRVFPVAGILTLVFGSWLVVENSVDPFEWSSLFVSVGLLVAIIGIATGIFFFMPQMKKIDAILASEGPGSPELVAIAKKNMMVTHLMAGILTIAMIVMVVQP